MLHIERRPSFLSPSALLMAENMPNTFYLTRLVADPIPRQPQALSAAVGSAFDYFIKVLLINEKFPNKKELLPDLRNGIETNLEEAFRAGQTAFNAYTNIFNIDDFTDTELHLSKVIEGIPLTGKIDALSDYGGGIIIPFDWKVMGYTATVTTSPPPLYYRLWEGIRPRPCHKDYIDGISFESIDTNWATQLCTYGWLIGIPIYKEFPARIDALIFKNRTIRCIAQYCGWITKSFQYSVMQRYRNIWTEVNDSSYLKRLVSTKSIDLVWIAAKNEIWYKEDPFGW